MGGNKELENKTIIHSGSWASNYNSWKELKKINRYLLIKYEDLTKDPKAIFFSVLKFIDRLTNKNLSIDKKKLINTLKTTTFEYLQKLEKNKPFAESQ